MVATTEKNSAEAFRNESFQYSQRSVIQAGPGATKRLASLFKQLGAKRIMLVSDNGLKDIGMVDQLIECYGSVAKPNSPTIEAVFTDTAMDAESSCINRALELAREKQIDALLALGGGSVLDSVKLLKLAMYKGVNHVDELLAKPALILTEKEVGPMGIPHIAVPTTAGTGAELTVGAVIYNKEKALKHLVIAPYSDADVAVLDAELTVGLPAGLTAATGLDALTHGIEALANPNCNDFSLAHAMLSVKRIIEYLPQCVANGTDVVARQKMLNASAMACNAFATGFSAAPVHNLSHAFGALFHIHHGEANGVLLPNVLSTIPEYYEPVAERLNNVLDLNVIGAREIVEASAEKINDLISSLGHPQDFIKYQIGEESLKSIVEAVAQDPWASFYPLGEDRITTITRKVCGW